MYLNVMYDLERKNNYHLSEEAKGLKLSASKALLRLLALFESSSSSSSCKESLLP
jgi:hypothetical protein